MIYISIFIACLYIFLIIAIIIGFDKVPTILNKNSNPKNTFSIVIPFRNEAENLSKLLHSISDLNYPKNLFEVLLVNDNSQDDSQSIIEIFGQQNPDLNIALVNSIRRTNAPKKDAINTAIHKAAFEWIVTTDADCELPLNWLQLFNQFIEEEQPLFISAPVKFKGRNSLPFHFQNLHFLSLIGSTIGGFGIRKPFMCNGANLCYRKDVFLQLNGFEGNTAIASGDDVFLLEKMNENYPDSVKFLKSEEAIVETSSEKNWSLFFNQQMRWASKSTAYNSSFSKFVGFSVFSINLLLIVLGVSALVLPFFWNYFLLLLFLKSIVDFTLIFKTSSFIKSKKSLKYFLGINLLYPFFIVFIGGISLFKSYTWKGRSFKK